MGEDVSGGMSDAFIADVDCAETIRCSCKGTAPTLRGFQVLDAESEGNV